MQFIKVSFLVLSILLAGCATSIPQAENFPQSKQKKIMAVQHWGLIANDAVEQTRWSLSKQSLHKDKPIFVADNAKTDFSRAFRKYMIAALLDAGIPVSTKKEGAIELDYEAQVIKHTGAFDPEAFGYKPGMATAGAAGFWVLRDVFTHSESGIAFRLTALALGADVYKAINPGGETPIELIISTSIVYQDRYIMLNADAYYIEKGEEWLFEECKGKMRRNCR